MHLIFFARLIAHHKYVNRAVFVSKTKILFAVFKVLFKAARFLLFPLAVYGVRLCAVNCLAVYVQPFADFQKHVLFFLANFTVWLRSDIQHITAVLRDDVNHIRQHLIRRFKLIALGVAPTVFGDGGIVLPKHGTHTVYLSAFHVKNRTALHDRANFVKHCYFFAPFYTAVIVICQEFL